MGLTRALLLAWDRASTVSWRSVLEKVEPRELHEDKVLVGPEPGNPLRASFQLSLLEELPDVEVDVYHPHQHGTFKAETGGLQEVQGQPQLQSKILFQERKDVSEWEEPQRGLPCVCSGWLQLRLPFGLWVLCSWGYRELAVQAFSATQICLVSEYGITGGCVCWVLRCENRVPVGCYFGSIR